MKQKNEDKTTQLYWKSNIPGLFEEILVNPGTSIMKVPLNITKHILAEMAEYVVDELKDEKMIAFCGRLGLLEASIPGKEGHKELTQIMDKYFLK